MFFISASAFHFLRNYDIIHRDLKPDNILIKMENSMPVIKIADFGFARKIGDYDVSNTFCGTPLYMVFFIFLLGGK